MNSFSGVAGGMNRKIQIEKPAVQDFEQEALLREVRKYVAMIPSEPEPNLGRVREIKEEIARGTYLTRDKIEEAASQLASRLAKYE